MKKEITDFEVCSVTEAGSNTVLLELQSPHQLPQIEPGQFVEAKIEDEPGVFLRRPISINLTDPSTNRLWLLVAAIGRGTRRMARLKEGDRLNLVLPLGNGFGLDLAKGSKALLVGGGVGVAPLLMLGRRLKEQGAEPTFLLGARSGAMLPERDMFEATARTLYTTEDGSLGQRGFVTGHTVLAEERFDKIYVCGPTPMMKAVAAYAYTGGICCEVSLENKMACGLGACLCCVTKTNQGHKCVCTEGPVFNIKDLPWQN